MTTLNTDQSSVSDLEGPCVRVEIATQLQQSVANAIKHKNSLSCLEDTIKIVNETPGAHFLLPKTKYMIRKSIKRRFVYEMHYECEKCNNFTGIEREESIKIQIECVHCKTPIKKKADNFFIYIPIKQQLEESIQKNWKSINDFKSSTRSDDYISDIHSGLTHKQLDARFPNTFNLSLSLNYDGAQCFKSVNNTLWPIQLIQNFLHPRNRYVTSNILIAALYLGKNKPRPDLFFLPLMKELREIDAAGGFKINDTVFRPFVTHCCCDLPARATLQCLPQYNGRFACGYCLHPGIFIRNIDCVKGMYCYVRSNEAYKLRTHSDSISILCRLEKKLSTEAFGFKKASILVGLPQFDLINGFSIDYMHGALLGITPKLVGLWCDSKNFKEKFYIKNKTILNDRIQRIKPPTVINRKPRSLDLKEKFKANEWRSLLLYYLRYCLVGLLDIRYIDHFYLLSSAIYILSKSEIHVEEIDEARAMLIKFANEFETLYGKHRVTMNLHLLRHLPDTVLQLGPLWANSMFAFEQKNGELINCVHAKSDVLLQIAGLYVIEVDNKMKSSRISFSCRKKYLKPHDDEEDLLNQYGISLNDGRTYWAAINVNGERFTSTAYKDTKSIDYFVVFMNGDVGKIEYYVESGYGNFALVDIFHTYATKNHLQEVESTKSVRMFKIEEIKEKLIYMKIGTKQIVSSLPNQYEKT